MALTWLMMSVEGPFLAAIIARLAEPKFNLAAFGVAFALALVLEAPVIMILSAATALVDGRQAFRKLRAFTWVLNIALTLALGLVLLPAVFEWIALRAMRLPPEVATLTHQALLWMLPWPAAIGYRRLYQGLLIRQHFTGRVALGTVLRLSTMATTATVLYLGFRWPGATVGAAALSFGVLVEAVASRLLARPVLARLGDGEPLSYGRIVSFYYPLALTSTIALAVHPLVTFFMGQSRGALESLAVLPVVNALSFIFRSAGLSYQEVAIALLAEDGEGRSQGQLGRFALYLGVGASLGLAAITWTPLARVWFHDVSGLSLELTAFAVLPARILTLLPALSVLLSMQRAVLVHGRRTGAITRATLLEVGGIIAILVLAVRGLDMVGAIAAALAFIVGRLAGNLYLIPPCREILASGKLGRRRSA